MALEEEPRHWDQEALRPSRWLSRAGRRPEVAEPLEDQDAFDGFAGSRRASVQPRLDHGLDERVQDFVAQADRIAGTSTGASKPVATSDPKA